MIWGFHADYCETAFCTSGLDFGLDVAMENFMIFNKLLIMVSWQREIVEIYFYSLSKSTRNKQEPERILQASCCVVLDQSKIRLCVLRW